jgi:hypothetical protein
MSDEADLPKALVKRLVKERLAARDPAAGDGEAAKSLQLNKVGGRRMLCDAFAENPQGRLRRDLPSCMYLLRHMMCHVLQMKVHLTRY